MKEDKENRAQEENGQARGQTHHIITATTVTITTTNTHLQSSAHAGRWGHQGRVVAPRQAILDPPGWSPLPPKPHLKLKRDN